MESIPHLLIVGYFCCGFFLSNDKIKVISYLKGGDEMPKFSLTDSFIFYSQLKPKPQSYSYNKVNEFVDHILANISCVGYRLEKKTFFNVDKSSANTLMTLNEIETGISSNKYVNIPYPFIIGFEKNLENTKDEFIISDISYVKNVKVENQLVEIGIYLEKDKILIAVVAT